MAYLHIWWWWWGWYLLWSFWKNDDTDDESDGDEHNARADGTSCTSAKSHCSSQCYASDTNGFGSHHLYHIKTGITDSTPPPPPKKRFFAKTIMSYPFLEPFPYSAKNLDDNTTLRPNKCFKISEFKPYSTGNLWCLEKSWCLT